jgi:sigma-B regulation protein RsbU (phosphoserine phosphatase)
MESTAVPLMRDQLLDRRRQLEAAARTPVPDAEVARLINEVDAALRRMDLGTFGICETCADSIEPDRLLADPLLRFCLDHLTAREQRALEQDLELAARIQRGLLPPAGTCLDGWETAYLYQPAGPVSGDFCDLIRGIGDDTYVVVGDVAGKGVAAAMLMSHLSALLRTLISVGLPLGQLVERTSRVFCETTLPTHYATLVCAHASANGEIEVANAGHPPPLIIRADGAIDRIDATGLPIGMFCSESFSSTMVRLAPGETLLLYTDGLVEAEDAGGEQYGIARLCALAASAGGVGASELVDRCGRDLASFRDPHGSRDDLTILAMRRN